METQFTTGIADGAAGEGYEVGVAAGRDAATDLNGERADFCQVFCTADFDYGDVLAGIRSVIGDEPALIGCAGTGPFTDVRSVESGVALALVRSETITFQTGIGTGLSESLQRALRDARKDLSDSSDSFPYRSALVLYDSLDSDGEELAHRVRRKLGARVPFAGGAASDTYRLESTPVFCGDRVENDAVVIATIDSEHQSFVVGNHGHEAISEPFEVTRVDGRRVIELDGRPALDVWRETVGPYAREMFDIDIDAVLEDHQTMLRMMGVFEFGIDQGNSYKMRACIEADPDAGSMSSLVNIPEGTHVQVMRGTVDSQIESARRAARSANDVSEGQYSGAFVYDCACRHVILGEEFDTAVDAMRDELHGPFVGFETYGEMNMNFGQTSGFHNSTTVINLFPT
jgi:methyl-accepting chemotaxis protein